MKPKAKTYFFYLLRCKDNSLYAGITDNLKKREEMHNIGKGSKYVFSKGGGKIIYSENFLDRTQALRREAEVKKWPKNKKEKLTKTNVA